MKNSISTIGLSLILVLSLSGKFVMAEDTPDKKAAIDWDRARTLFEKQQKGEKLSDDEQAYLKRAMAEKAAGGDGGRTAPPAEAERGRAPADGGRGAAPPAENGRERRGEGERAREGDAGRAALPADFDTKRFSELMQKMRKGEALTPDEEQFVRRGKELMQSRRQGDGDAARGGTRGGDSFTDVMIPSELLIKHSADLKLDETQVKSIQEEIQKAQERFPEMQKNLRDQMGALIEQMRADKIDEEKAVASLDKVLDAERDIKRTQLMLNIKVRGKLTAEQQTALRDLRPQLQSEMHAGGRREAAQTRGIKEKFDRLQVLIRRMKDDGKDTSASEQAVQQAMAMMRDGKIQEAEALIDTTSKSLGEGATRR